MRHEDPRLTPVPGPEETGVGLTQEQIDALLKDAKLTAGQDANEPIDERDFMRAEVIEQAKRAETAWQAAEETPIPAQAETSAVTASRITQLEAALSEMGEETEIPMAAVAHGGSIHTPEETRDRLESIAAQVKAVKEAEHRKSWLTRGVTTIASSAGSFIKRFYEKKPETIPDAFGTGKKAGAADAAPAVEPYVPRPIITRRGEAEAVPDAFGSGKKTEAAKVTAEKSVEPAPAAETIPDAFGTGKKVEKVKTPAEINAIMDKALDTPGFSEFLDKHTGGAEWVAEKNAKEISSRLEIFNRLQDVRKNMKTGFMEFAKAQMSVKGMESLIKEKDFELVDEHLTKLAIENPEAFAEYMSTAETFGKLPREIEKKEGTIQEYIEKNGGEAKTAEEMKAALSNQIQELAGKKADKDVLVTALQTIRRGFDHGNFLSNIVWNSIYSLTGFHPDKKVRQARREVRTKLGKEAANVPFVVEKSLAGEIESIKKDIDVLEQKKNAVVNLEVEVANLRQRLKTAREKIINSNFEPYKVLHQRLQSRIAEYIANPSKTKVAGEKAFRKQEAVLFELIERLSDTEGDADLSSLVEGLDLSALDKAVKDSIVRDAVGLVIEVSKKNKGAVTLMKVKESLKDMINLKAVGLAKKGEELAKEKLDIIDRVIAQIAANPDTKALALPLHHIKNTILN